MLFIDYMNFLGAKNQSIHIQPPVTNGDRLLFRVYDNASPIGYARLKKVRSRKIISSNTIDMFDPNGVDSCELKMIEVAQNYRQRGVGTSLLNEVIRYCQDSNICCITGEIKGDLRVLKSWYRSKGFTVNDNNRIELLPAANS